MKTLEQLAGEVVNITPTGVYLEIIIDTYHIPSWYVFDEVLLSVRYNSILDIIFKHLKRRSDCEKDIKKCESTMDFRNLILRSNSPYFDHHEEKLKPFLLGFRFKDEQSKIL